MKLKISSLTFQEVVSPFFSQYSSSRVFSVNGMKARTIASFFIPPHYEEALEPPAKKSGKRAGCPSDFLPIILYIFYL